MKTCVDLIKDFFGTDRPVSIDELKALSAAERRELADSIAEQLGLRGEELGASFVYSTAA